MNAQEATRALFETLNDSDSSNQGNNSDLSDAETENEDSYSDQSTESIRNDDANLSSESICNFKLL